MKILYGFCQKNRNRTDVGISSECIQAVAKDDYAAIGTPDHSSH